jgi:hypothetical protein
MGILAIDPGPEHSAYLFYRDGKLGFFDKISNEELLHLLKHFTIEEMAIEMIQSFGMPVGQTVFDTCVWIGRFIQEWQPKIATKVYRQDVKMHICHNQRAKDSNIRQALIDRFPASGGGKCPQIGTKKQPGPLYGVTKDIWSALAIAITFDERK